MPKKFNIPIPSTPASSSGQFQLPYRGTVVSDGGFSFSFAAFDRSHKLFNLGDDSKKSGVVSGKWFIELLDCLKDLSKMTVNEIKTSMHDLHPVDWDKANTSMPSESHQCEYWQFRINKSKGRVIGVITVVCSTLSGLTRIIISPTVTAMAQKNDTSLRSAYMKRRKWL